MFHRAVIRLHEWKPSRLLIDEAATHLHNFHTHYFRIRMRLRRLFLKNIPLASLDPCIIPKILVFIISSGCYNAHGEKILAALRYAGVCKRGSWPRYSTRLWADT